MCRNKGGKNVAVAGNPVDRHVGEQLRRRRVLLGMSQQKLADALGLVFQQVQKYEKGTNRLGASRLFDAARILDVPIGYFFADMPESVMRCSPASRGNPSASDEVVANAESGDVMGRRETIRLVRSYYQIKDNNVRKTLLAMARAMARLDDGEMS